MNKIEQAIRNLQLYIDVEWGGTSDMLSPALTALKDFCKLQQENEQLQIQAAQMRETLRKAREVLHKGISELKMHCKYFDQTLEEDICIEMHEAIIEIDKIIGGKEI